MNYMFQVFYKWQPVGSYVLSYVICLLLVMEVGHAPFCLITCRCILIYHSDSSLTMCISSRVAIQTFVKKGTWRQSLFLLCASSMLTMLMKLLMANLYYAIGTELLGTRHCSLSSTPSWNPSCILRYSLTCSQRCKYTSRWDSPQ